MSSNAVIVENLGKAFQAKDKSGFLPYADFKKVLDDKKIGISPRGVIMSLVECEIDNNGKINYSEFLKKAFTVLNNAANTAPLIITDGTGRAHIHGMIREDFLKTLVRKLTEYKVKGDKGLNRTLIRNALRDGEIGFSHREVNYGMGFIEENYLSGQFDYNVLSDSLWELLLVAHDQNYFSLPVIEEAATEYLVGLFQKVDVEKKGELPPASIQKVLVTAELGFTSLQVNALLGLLGDLNDNVNYKAFTEFIAEWLVRLIRGRDLFTPSPQIAGMLREDLTAHLLKECQKLDSKKTGLIKYTDLHGIITGLSFSPREQSAILSLVLPNMHDAKGVPYQGLVQLAYDVCWLQQKLGIDDIG